MREAEPVMTPLVDNAAWARTNTCSVLWPVPVPDADEVRTAVTGHNEIRWGLLFDTCSGR